MTEPIAYAIHDIEHGGSRSLIWADQYTPEGDSTKFDVTPLVSFERGKDGFSKDELKVLSDLSDRGFAVCVFNPEEAKTMPDTKPPTPTDAELDELRQANSGRLNFVTLREFRTIARAVLEKWGTPAHGWKREPMEAKK